MTLRQAISAASAQLAQQPELAPTADRDATLLLLHTLALPPTTIYSYPGRLMNDREQVAYSAAITRRLRFEPVQYITGHVEFFGLDLEVNAAVLIPRPETELLVEAALARLPQDVPLRIADIGAGSGAIAIAIASRLPQARLTAVDLSSAALIVARTNARRHSLSDHIHFLHGDLLAALPPDEPPFDAIVSNPPYVPETDRAGLHPQVRDYEPAQALFAGQDGLTVYARLIPQACTRLRSAGLLALEIGQGQQPAIAHLLNAWNAVDFLPDLQGIPRIALARKP